MSAEGAWLAVAPFLVAFAITLMSTFTLPSNWMTVYDTIRRKRSEKFKARRKKNKGDGNTALQMLYGGMNLYWWAPIVIYAVCMFLAVLGIVLFNHEGYVWSGAAFPHYDIPLVYAGFWMTVILVSHWIVKFLSVCIDNCAPTFIPIFGTWLLHLAVWISMVKLHPYGWLQLPLFLGITAIFVASVLSFFRCNNRYVVVQRNKNECKTSTVIEPGCSSNKYD